MKGRDLVGKRVTLRVKETPCACRFDPFDILEKTEDGVITGFQKWLAGWIGFLKTDDGRNIEFDADLDVKAGKIEIEAPSDT